MKNIHKIKKIQNAILKAEKEKEEKLMKRTNHFNEVRQNVKNNERKSATKRLFSSDLDQYIKLVELFLQRIIAQ